MLLNGRFITMVWSGTVRVCHETRGQERLIKRTYEFGTERHAEKAYSEALACRSNSDMFDTLEIRCITSVDSIA